ncbi:TetR/AcrR family transcriptional regulator [Rhodococcoides yunnanense]|uniref:TetR/AcrR family transcriptional regulator n=1 Tax=Rhodococcoides yunnanense TaxID=278209 RepID=UPI0009322AB7|nr:TetR/AcrR family transcriptional regulator [Rhodococcus yunnanensis]
MTELNTRAKIIVAACELFGEDPASTLSVRTVAARAGVSMGSLRHHFPTQRALRDAVLETIYDVATPGDDVIHDRTVPARDRLVQCLRQILAPQTGTEKRQGWIKVFEAFIVPEPTDAMRAAYQSLEDEGRRRMEHWLATLAKEGHGSGDDSAKHADFLNTVLNGLSIQRALPFEVSALEHETATLYFAVDAVLGTQR